MAVEKSMMFRDTPELKYSIQCVYAFIRIIKETHTRLEGDL